MSPPVAVVPVTVSDSASEPHGMVGRIDPPRIHAAIDQGLLRATIEAAWLTGPCPDRACWLEEARGLGSSYVLLPRFERRDPHVAVILELVELERGEVVASVDELCELCGEQEIAATAADLAKRIAPRLGRQELQHATIVLAGEPAGAMVELDGEPVGTLPWSGELAVGTHTLRVVKEGYFASTRSIEATAGVREHIDIQLRLQPRPEPPPTIDSPPPLPPARSDVGWLAAGGTVAAAGGVTLGLGIGLFAFDGRPYRRTCDVPDRNGQCPEVHETTRSAVVTSAVGSVVTAVGLAVVITTLARRARPQGGHRASLVPAPRGLGATLRF